MKLFAVLSMTTWFDMFRIKDGKLAEHWDYGTKR